MSDKATARAHAEEALGYRSEGLSASGALLLTGRRLGWALLDIADAVREHGEQTRPAEPSGPLYVNRRAGG